MKKKMIIGILSAAILITVCCTVYVVSGNSTRTQELLAYLETKGYTASEIRKVTVKHSFVNLLLGYAEWSGYAEFEDEIGILYHYSFRERISQGGFSGYAEVYGNLDKDDLLDNLKHLER